MTDSIPAERPCATCGAPVTEINGSIVHVGGGQVGQRCTHCGFKGSQYGKYSACPRCNQAEYLVDDHNAS